MRKINPLLDLDPPAAPPPQRGAGEVAKTIDGEAGRFVEPGEEHGRGEMGQMVLDVMHLGRDLDAVGLLQRFAHGGSAAQVLNLLPHQAWIGQMSQDEPEPPPVVRTRFAVDRNMVDLA